MKNTNTIYIAATPTQLSKGLVKVGITDRPVAKRIRESNTTALEENYKLIWFISSPSYAACEKYIHNHFKRLRRDREFVFATPEEAKAAILEYLGKRDRAIQIQNIIAGGKELIEEQSGATIREDKELQEIANDIMKQTEDRALNGRIDDAMSFAKEFTGELLVMLKGLRAARIKALEAKELQKGYTEIAKAELVKKYPNVLFNPATKGAWMRVESKVEHTYGFKVEDYFTLLNKELHDEEAGVVRQILELKKDIKPFIFKDFIAGLLMFSFVVSWWLFGALYAITSRIADGENAYWIAGIITFVIYFQFVIRNGITRTDKNAQVRWEITNLEDKLDDIKNIKND